MILLTTRIAFVFTLLLASRAWADDAAPNVGQAASSGSPLAIHAGLLFPDDSQTVSATGSSLYNLGLRYDFGRFNRKKQDPIFSLTVDGFAESGRQYVYTDVYNNQVINKNMTGRMAGGGVGVCIRQYIASSNSFARPYISAGVGYYLMQFQNGDRYSPPYSTTDFDLEVVGTLGLELRSGIYFEISSRPLPSATANPSGFQVVLGDRIPGIAPGDSAPVGQFLQRVRLSYGHYRINEGESYPRTIDYGAADGVSLDIVRAHIASYPAVTNLYFDAMTATNDGIDSVGLRQRTMHGYGVE